MNIARRGTPKKRFLWRRLLPSKDDRNSNLRSNPSSNDESQANSNTACHEQNQEITNDYACIASSPFESATLSEEGDAQSSPENATSLKKTWLQLNSEEWDVTAAQQDTAKKERSVRGIQRPTLWFPRPFLASVDSPVSGLWAAPDCRSRSSSLVESRSNKPKDAEADKDTINYAEETQIEEEDETHTEEAEEGQTEQERETAEKAETDEENTHVVLSTAASVLLLMRFSVTEEALSTLTRGGSNSEKESSKQEEQSRKDECQEKSDIQPVESPSSPHLVSPETSSKPGIVRVVSLPEDTTTSCPNRLAMPEDPNELNSLHCFVRAHLLEVFSLPPHKDKPGRVGLRCVFCSHLPRKQRSGTTMCTFYPKSLQDLYRSVMTWQRIHFRSCKHVSPKMKEEYWKHKQSDQTRGKTTYWITSAMRLGLQDINNGRNGICFVGALQAS